ncbi:DUF58 domain-containing protein [Sinomonas halotolerans]|uniref:DUF58 domain-containing protein n=1 Tax=Sinomonas halotolerans TaxID=1644133 RepID=A0ABU9WZN5_9MICC
MGSLVTRVRTTMALFAHRRARTMLDGQYGSAFRGRSLDFDDLRAYIPGDDVRDIDWKATARVGAPLVTRYEALRRQNVLLVADTGRNMSALARGGGPKKEIALLALGVIGWLAQRHGDRVALVAGDAASSQSVAPRSGEAHLERLLRAFDGAAGPGSGPSDLTAQLDHAVRTVRARGLMFVVADEAAFDERDAALVRRLAVQHEILWLTVRDAELAGAGAPGRARDVADGGLLLSLLARAPEVEEDYRRLMAERTAARAGALRRLGIAEVHADTPEDVIPALFRLLERHRRAR